VSRLSRQCGILNISQPYRLHGLLRGQLYLYTPRQNLSDSTSIIYMDKRALYMLLMLVQQVFLRDSSGISRHSERRCDLMRLRECFSCCCSHAVSAASVEPWQSFSWRWSMCCSTFCLLSTWIECGNGTVLFPENTVVSSLSSYLAVRMKYARSFMLSIILHSSNSGYSSVVGMYSLALVH
jgi:hypothetical protein